MNSNEFLQASTRFTPDFVLNSYFFRSLEEGVRFSQQELAGKTDFCFFRSFFVTENG